MAIIRFPYEQIAPLEVPDRNLLGVFSPPRMTSGKSEQEILLSALANPIGAPHIADALKYKRSILIVSDDHHRPTPVRKLLPLILQEISGAGIANESVEIIMALGSHRPMSDAEIREKLGAEVVETFSVSNHEWMNPENLYFAGHVPPGIDVWVNAKMRHADFVVGLGQVMPMDVCGFTGGSNIIVPGLCGPKTSADFHWLRVGMNAAEVLGRRENAVREAIDNSAMAAGLSAILNVVLDSEGAICSAVYGHPIEAHRRAIPDALRAHTITLPSKADIVVADGFPFDIEFWQVNKALDNASLAVRNGGVIIIVSPCYEGLSITHGDEISRIGYRSKREILRLVEEGKFTHRVAAVHMIQVAEATIEKHVRCILVTDGIPADVVHRLNLDYAPDPQAALFKAFGILGNEASVAVLRRAAESLPRIQEG